MAKEPKSGVTVDEDLIRQLSGLLDETGLDEIELQEGSSKIRVAKGGATVVQAANPAVATGSLTSPPPGSPAPEDDLASHPGAITSPMVGVCYLAKDPGSPAFCNEGETVRKGDTLVLIEAMKVFNPITAPKDGTVTRILVSDGTPVEYGEPLVIVE